jgi:hypothetical protein
VQKYIIGKTNLLLSRFLFISTRDGKVFAYFKAKKIAFCKLDITKIPIFAVEKQKARYRTQQAFTI